MTNYETSAHPIPAQPPAPVEAAPDHPASPFDGSGAADTPAENIREIGTVRALDRAIEAAKALRQEIARLACDDEQAIQDSFDGETTLDAEIRAAVLLIEEDGILVTGIKAREAELLARRQRFEKRVEATRGLIEQAITVARWTDKPLIMDIGTVSLGKSPSRIEIDNEVEIPSQFFKRGDPKLDRAGLLASLRERDKAMRTANAIKDPEKRAAEHLRINTEMPSIPGCHLEHGGSVLKIKRS